MIPMIQQAMFYGYTAVQVLEFLTKKFPELTKSVEKSKEQGYDPETILEFISKNQGRMGFGVNNKKKQQQTDDANQTSYENYLQNAGLTEKPKDKAQKAVGGIFGQTIKNIPTFYGLAMMGANLYGMGKKAIGSVPNVGSSQAPVQPEQPINPAQPIQPTAPSPAGPVEARQATTPDPASLLKEMGILPTVDTMSSASNAPEVIADVLGMTMTPEQKKFIKDKKIDLGNVIGQYISKKPTQPKDQQQGQEAAKFNEMTQPTPQQPETQQTQANEVEQAVQAKQPELPSVEPGKEVALPDGSIGEIEKVDPKGRYVTVKVDGKMRNVKFDDVEVEPENVVEFVNHVAGIPESERSRLISFFAYQPETKTLAVQFHNGTFYTYSDVDPEKIKPIAEAKGTPKTSGQDEYGAHVAGVPDSRGAALIEEIINNEKYKKSKKGESQNKNYQAFETLYDYWKAFRKKPKRKKVGSQS